MAVNLNDISTKVMKLMQGNGHKMRMFDANSGTSVATPDQARFFYVKDPNMMVHIDDNTNELKFHIGEDVAIDNPKINNTVVGPAKKNFLILIFLLRFFLNNSCLGLRNIKGLY